jgi:hypothetical protein
MYFVADWNLSSFPGGQQLRSLAMAPVPSSPKEQVDQLVADNTVMVFSKTTCPFCTKIKNLFEGLKIKIEVLELDKIGMSTLLK